MLTWMPALALVVCSCTLEDEVPAAARISATFGLRSPSALDGKIVIGEAYLKLHRLEVTGTLNGSSVTQVNHTVAPEESPYRLTTSDSSHAGFALGSTTYDQL